MKYCENCGSQMQDQDLFCNNCGSKIKNSCDEVATPCTSEKSKLVSVLKKKKVFIPLIIGILIILCGTIVMSQIRKKVNINDYIKVSFSGYDGAGVASYKLDYDGFIGAILKAQGKSSDELSVNKFMSDDFNGFLTSEIAFKFDKSKGLKNGDSSKLIIKYREEAEKELGVRFVSENTKYTIKNLKSPKKVDPFESISVSFEGTSPNARIEIANKSKDDYLQGLSFECSKEEEIKKGDVITVKINQKPKNALERGYIFSESSKEYKCEKIDEYLIDLTTIQEQQLLKLQKETTDKIEAFFARNIEYLSYDNLKYAGAYLLNQKNNSSNNKLYILYSLTVTSKETGKDYTFAPTTIYYTCEINDIILKADGTIEYREPYIYPHSTDLTYSFYMKVPGYSDGAQMFADLVVSQKDDYEYQVSGDISQFGK